MSTKQYSSLWHLLSYLPKHKYLLLAVFFFLSLSVLSILALGINIRYFTNHALDNSISLGHSTKLFLGLLLILAIASALRSYFIEMLCSKTCNDLRHNLYDALLNTQLQYLESNHKSRFSYVISNDLPVIHTLIQTIFSFFIRNLLMLVGSIIMIFKINPYLSLAMLILIPLVLSPIIPMGKKLKIFALSYQKILSEIGIKAQETIHALKDIQANCQEAKESKSFNTLLSNLSQSNEQKFRHRSFLVGLVILGVSYSIVGIFWLGSYQIIIHSINPGDLISFVFYAVIVASTLSGMSEVYNDLHKAAAAADSIKKYLYSTQCPNLSKSFSQKAQYGLSFNNVSFHYPRSKNIVLKNTHLVIKPGEKLGIIGKSGSGKSSLLQLILRFYSPTSGTISISNQNIESLNPLTFRSILSYVSQEPYLFPISIKDNIKYGNDSTTDDKMIKTMKILDMHDFIKSLPNGYDTLLDPKGDNLSGGQKQRIAIARSILRKSQILLLDEITSFIDQKNEEAICELLKEDSRTMLIVSHKPKILSICQRVIELKRGKIIDL